MDDRLFVELQDGTEKEMRIYFTFDSEEYGKSYVLFYDPDEVEEVTYAMSYDEEGNLSAIEDENEWAMIEEVLGAFNDEQEEEE